MFNDLAGMGVERAPERWFDWVWLRAHIRRIHKRIFLNENKVILMWLFFFKKNGGYISLDIISKVAKQVPKGLARAKWGWSNTIPKRAGHGSSQPSPNLVQAQSVVIRLWGQAQPSCIRSFQIHIPKPCFSGQTQSFFRCSIAVPNEGRKLYKIHF